MSTEETSARKKKTTLTAKKKILPSEETYKTQEITHKKKKKTSPDKDTPKKKRKASPDEDAPKKKRKASPDEDAPKKKRKASLDEDAPKKKRKASPDEEVHQKKKKSASHKEKSADSKPQRELPPPVKNTSQPRTHKKKKFRLKRGVKVVLFMFCAVCIFCGVIAFKNTRPSPVEADTTLEEETTEETLPETTEEPTTETTEEPTTEIDENAPFIDYEMEIDPNKPMIALTYDDGPSAEGSTAQLLDLLEEYHAHATFFIVGKNITPETKHLLQREVELGCEVANHSWGHENLSSMTLEEALESLKKCDDAIYKVIKRYPQHVRPPYGAYTDELLDEDGRTFIYWSLDTSDWKLRNVKKDYQVLMDNIGDGDIILMHDIHQETADASEQFIPDLIDMGYQLVTVSELMYYRNLTEKDGMVLFNVHPDEPFFKNIHETASQDETDEEPEENETGEEDEESEEVSDESDADSEEETPESESETEENSVSDSDENDTSPDDEE